MGMTEQEKLYKKYIRKKILAENGYATYADILGLLDLHITAEPGVIAFMDPKTGEITINENLDASAVSVAIRHEILHHFLQHERRLLTKLAKNLGQDIDTLDDLSIRKLEQYLHRNLNFNIAGDYEISNRGYTDEDKQTIRNIVLNGDVLRGLVTEDDHPDWIDWSIEDMYDALNKQSNQIPPPQPPPNKPRKQQGPEGPTGPGGQNGPDGQSPQNGQPPQNQPNTNPEKQDNPNSDVQQSIEDIKKELHKAGLSDEQIDDILDKMEKEFSDTSDGDSDSDSNLPYVDPNNFKSNDEIKKDLKDKGLGERDSKRVLKKVKAAKEIAEKEAEKDRQEGASKGEIGYKGDKEFQQKEKEKRDAQIKKEQEEKSKNKDNQSDDEEHNKDKTQSSDDEDPYKDYEDEYDSSKETASQRKDRLSKISKIFSDPAVAAKIDRENQAKIQASKDAKARKEVRRYMTSDAMKFQMNIKRFLNNEFGEDRETTWGRRHRANLNRPGSDRKILLPGKKIQDTERPTKPLINVYFDQSGSWNPDDLRAGNQAVSQMNKLVKDGKLEVQVYYFDDELHNTPPTNQGGTRGTPIINHIKQTHPDNVIIMTDSDIDDINEQITVPGMVWILWKNGLVSQNLKDSIHGQKGTEYYNIEVG